MSSRYEDVNELLDLLDIHQSRVNSKKSIVDSFLRQLKSKFDKETNFIIRGSELYKFGSSYENTVVSRNADFDVGIVLPYPFVMDYFQSIETTSAGVYKLRCIGQLEYFKNLINKNGFLKVKELRNRIFSELIDVIEGISLDGYKFIGFKLSSVVRVTLKTKRISVRIDIAPQIEGNVWDGDIPGWSSDNMSPIIENFMDHTDRHMLFKLACPPHLTNEEFCNYVVQPVFGIIEKGCMLKSGSAREAVRIAKGVMKRYNWMKDGLRSFHIKRIALYLYDEIEDSDPWDGFKLIMRTLTDMLELGVVYGCFIKGQNIISKNRNECQKLGEEMRVAVKNIRPCNILKQLGYS